jgi:hypothetical protein
MRKATKATDKPATAAPATAAPATAAPEKPARFVHAPALAAQAATIYAGASRGFRQHDHKLRPVVPRPTPSNFTIRDEATTVALLAAYKHGDFKRGDIDAGYLGRNIGHRTIRHVSGDLASRDAVFACTVEAPAIIARERALREAKAKRAAAAKRG